MTILRVAVDIEVKEHPTGETLNKVSEAVRRFANGSVPGVYLHVDDKSSHASAHVHASSPDYACSECIELAQDERN